jgi:hypothetical protein
MSSNGMYEDGGLYRVWSRNFTHAIYRLDENLWLGVREKFGRVFLETESPDRVNPKEFICLCPILPLEETNKALLMWLQATITPKETR